MNARLIAALSCVSIIASLALIMSGTFANAKEDPQQTPQITISGIILDNQGRPIQDVVVTVSGTRRAGTLTGPEGRYSVSLPMGGSYAVTASSSGILFQPSGLSFSNVNSDVSNANFVGTRTRTFRVSGTIVDPSGVAAGDVVIRIGDSPQVLTLTGPGGFYVFDHLTAGVSYTLTPSKAGITFDPSSFTIANLNRDLSEINFVAVPHDRVRIGGIVFDSAGQPLADVIVGLSGAEPTLTTTGTTGAFVFTVPSGGNYLVAPARNGYTFTPPSLTFNDLTQSQSAANFVGTLAPTFAISGVVLDSSGAPIIDVPVVMVGSANGTVPTGPVGNYSFTALIGSGTYTIAPSVPGMVFIPPGRTFSNLSSDQIGVNFVGSAATGRPESVSPAVIPGNEPAPSASPSPSPSASVRPSPEPTPSPESTPKNSEKTRQKTADKDSTTPAPPAPSPKTGPLEKASAVQRKPRSRRTRSRRRGVGRARRSGRSSPRAPKRPSKKNPNRRPGRKPR